MRRLPLSALLLLALVLGPIAGCSGDRPSLAAADPEPVVTAAPGKVATLDDRAIDAVIVATAVVASIAVYDAPDAPEPVRTLANPIASGGPLVFVVDRSAGGWLQVLLPTAPAGSTAWVRASDVTTARHNYRIAVHLSEFRLDVFLAGKVVRQIKIGVAKGSTPEPGARYYTTELLQPATPDPVYGTFAYGLSGFSATGEAFSGAPGQFGIHGTNEPDTIGTSTSTSAGCIRMGNEDIEDLASFLPLGVPVTIDR